MIPSRLRQSPETKHRAAHAKSTAMAIDDDITIIVRRHGQDYGNTGNRACAVTDVVRLKRRRMPSLEDGAQILHAVIGVRQHARLPIGI